MRPDDEHSGDAELVSPMPGSVVAVGVQDGDARGRGRRRRHVEAMKMEHALTAPVDGVVELLVAVGRPGQGGPAAGPDHRNTRIEGAPS